MDIPTSNSLAADLQAGFKEPNGASGSQDGSDHQPTPEEIIAAKDAQIHDLQIASANTQGKLDALSEHNRPIPAQPQPKIDVLKDAIEALPEDERDAAEKLKPVLERIISSQKDGYMSKTDVEKLLQDNVNDSQKIADYTVWKDSMAKEWDGKDGKPKFDAEKLEEFMEKKGYKDPLDSFYLFHRAELLRYASTTKNIPPSKLDAGGKPIPAVKFTPPKNRQEAQDRIQQSGTEIERRHGLI